MKLSAFDRFTLSLAPDWTRRRLQARAAALALVGRNYDAASVRPRTANWNRQRGDANAVIGRALAELRTHARDLLRNNSWAKRGRRTIANNVVGWGVIPKPVIKSEVERAKALEKWKAWANSTECDAEGRRTFAGILSLVMSSLVESGEVLIRKRARRIEDGLSIPMQLQVLEADYLDTDKEEDTSFAGGPIRQGVEFDKLGRRAAYWLFPEHPGSTSAVDNVSRRIPAESVAHVFYGERPGQVRGVSWLAAAIVNLKDLDDYEDAELMKQKIAACFAAFVTDTDGAASPIGDEDTTETEPIEDLEPGMINYLPPGKSVQFGNPPVVTADSFASRQLRRVAAGLGVTYEDLTGDYSQVNFSSARLARLSYQAHVRDWQYNMLIPQACTVVWDWAMNAIVLAGELSEAPGSEWTVQPLPMIEPDKEGLALGRLVRVGAMTPSEMVREQGGDPEAHWLEYAADMATLDKHKIQLDSDVRAVSQAGLTQVRAGGGSAAPKDPPAADTGKKPIPEKSAGRAEPVMLDVRGPLELLRSK